MKRALCLLLSLSAYASAMTLEEKVGQIIMCPVNGQTINEEMKDLIKEAKIGGVILYNWANELDSKDDIRELTSQLQLESLKETGAPLFIGIDQEGGRVERIDMEMPSAQELSESKLPKKAYKAGKKIGKALFKLGINVNFAPVVDINSNEENIVIGDRSFGSDPEVVTEYAKAFAKGLEDKDVLSCLKHFPGHGDVTADSHFTLPVSDKSLEDLMDLELIPYKELADNSPFIMSAHILFPNIDKDNPATLSKIFLQDILRNKLEYNGLIITDSLRMDGILTKPMHEIAIEAFNAGNDIILIGGNRLIEEDPSLNAEDIKLLHKELVAAVNDGRISMERLNKSVERIMHRKSKLKTLLTFDFIKKK